MAKGRFRRGRAKVEAKQAGKVKKQAEAKARKSLLAAKINGKRLRIPKRPFIRRGEANKRK